MTRQAWIGGAVCMLLFGCDGPSPDADAGALDAGSTIADASSTGDAASSDGGAALDEVTVSYRGHTERLDRAYFGYERAAGEVTGLYFELSRGGADGCPTESSPTPDQTLIVSGFGGTDPSMQSFADGVRASFFDFEGVFRDELAPAAATDVSVELTAHDEAAGVARVALEVTFDEGAASGTFAATHCPSLDADS